MEKPLSGVEAVKLGSRYLRGTLSEELANDEPLFTAPATGVLKFHGIYQQDDRDLRKSGVKQYSAMVRVGVPGGVLTPEQYLTLDRLAELGDGSLRITTRQDIQYHYVPKARLRELIQTLHGCYLGTLAACGDVVRNVISCPAPFANDERKELQPFVSYLSKNLKPKTTAYYEIWIDGEKAVSGEQNEQPQEVEPLYGATYLPRKFKIGFTFPGDNTTDIYANDIGIVPHYEDGVLTGFNILAGGGMGQSAGVKSSHPRLADPLCFVGPTCEELLEIASAIISIHRDFGNRSNRKLARLKYVMEDWGVAKFKQELELRVGRQLADAVPLHWTRSNDYLGWRRQTLDSHGDPVWFYGVRVISGRIRDFSPQQRIRTGLRAVVERYGLEVRLTCQQNMYLCGIRERDRPGVASLLREHGIAEPLELPPVLRHAIACPALPTCALAITESERIMPDLVGEIQSALNQLGLQDQIIHFRTSGCPNGCSRPYTAEIGIVGASVNMYTIYLGASRLGTRLGEVFAQNVKREQLLPKLQPVFEYYKRSRQAGEYFGDFCHRIGIQALQDVSMYAAA
ncbi:MAG: NADPH-dependent assimilatory sulfite reductase hemoprotein subunit [Acidobacteriaceae bacterium]|nr:NADPH-dependent assimilatory sulfite reductase hemoprotein subunit [Acidobacteriaceae bacterium]